MLRPDPNSIFLNSNPQHKFNLLICSNNFSPGRQEQDRQGGDRGQQGRDRGLEGGHRELQGPGRVGGLCRGHTAGALHQPRPSG